MADKMMRIAGRNPSGNAKALQTDANGFLKTTLAGDTPDLLVTYCRGIKNTAIDGVNTVTYFYYHLTSALGGLSSNGSTVLNQQVGGFADAATNALYRRWKISVKNGTNQSAGILIYPAGYWTESQANYYKIMDSSIQAQRMTIYESDADGFEANRVAIFSSLGGGVSAPNSIAVPELDGFYVDIVLRVKFATAPTSGNITVAYEAQK